MDDLSGRLGEILNSPEGMEQLKSLAGMLGLSGGSPAPAQPAASASAHAPAQEPAAPSMPSMEGLQGLMGMLGGLGGGAPAAPPSAEPAAGTDDMLRMMMKLAPLMGGLKQEDENTRFLAALRPLLSAERQKKLDEAIHILRLIRMMPLLKSSGILSSLF